VWINSCEDSGAAVDLVTKSLTHFPCYKSKIALSLLKLREVWIKSMEEVKKKIFIVCLMEKHFLS